MIPKPAPPLEALDPARLKLAALPFTALHLQRKTRTFRVALQHSAWLLPNHLLLALNARGHRQIWVIRSVNTHHDEPNHLQVEVSPTLGNDITDVAELYELPASHVLNACMIQEPDVLPIHEEIPHLRLSLRRLVGLTRLEADHEDVGLDLLVSLLMNARHERLYPFVVDPYGIFKRLNLPATEVIELGRTHAFALEDWGVDALVNSWIDPLPGPLREEAWQQWAKSLSYHTQRLNTLDELETIFTKNNCGMLLRLMAQFKKNHLFCEGEHQSTFNIALALKDAESANRLMVLDVSRIPKESHAFMWDLLSVTLGRIALPANRFMGGIISRLPALEDDVALALRRMCAQGFNAITLHPFVLNHGYADSTAQPVAFGLPAEMKQWGINHYLRFVASLERLYFVGDETLNVPLLVELNAQKTIEPNLLEQEAYSVEEALNEAFIPVEHNEKSLDVVSNDAVNTPALPEAATPEADMISAREAEDAAPKAVEWTQVVAPVSEETTSVEPRQSTDEDIRGFNMRAKASNALQHHNVVVYGSLNPLHSTLYTHASHLENPDEDDRKKSIHQKALDFIQAHPEDEHLEDPISGAFEQGSVLEEPATVVTDSLGEEQAFLLSFNRTDGADAQHVQRNNVVIEDATIQSSGVTEPFQPFDETDGKEEASTPSLSPVKEDDVTNSEYYSSILGKMPAEWRELIQKELLTPHQKNDETHQKSTTGSSTGDSILGYAGEHNEDSLVDEPMAEQVHPCLPESMLEEVKPFLGDDFQREPKVENLLPVEAFEKTIQPLVKPPSGKGIILPADEPDDYKPLLHSEYLSDVRQHTSIYEHFIDRNTPLTNTDEADAEGYLFGHSFDPYYFPTSSLKPTLGQPVVSPTLDPTLPVHNLPAFADPAPTPAQQYFVKEAILNQSVESIPQLETPEDNPAPSLASQFLEKEGEAFFTQAPLPDEFNLNDLEFDLDMVNDPNGSDLLAGLGGHGQLGEFDPVPTGSPVSELMSHEVPIQPHVSHLSPATGEAEQGNEIPEFELPSFDDASLQPHGLDAIFSNEALALLPELQEHSHPDDSEITATDSSQEVRHPIHQEPVENSPIVQPPPANAITPPALEDAIPMAHQPAFHAEPAEVNHVSSSQEEDQDAEEPAYEPGMHVHHDTYGKGVVQNVVEMDERIVLSILFDEAGKRLLDPSLTQVHLVTVK